MLSITPINNKYYNKSISSKSDARALKNPDLDQIRRELAKMTIEMEEVIPPEKNACKSFFARIKDRCIGLSSCLTQTMDDGKLETLPYIGVWTELHYICCDGDLTKFKNFIKKHPNFDPNQRTRDGYNYSYNNSYIHHCVVYSRNDYKEILNILAANKNIDLSRTDTEGYNDMYMLCMYRGTLEAVKIFIENHPDFDLKQYQFPNYTYIDAARRHKHYDIADYLTKLKQKRLFLLPVSH